MHEREILKKAGFFLPKSISTSMRRLYELYAEDGDESYLIRFREVLNGAKNRYRDFARAVDGHTSEREDYERMLPGAHWAAYRARLTGERV